MKGDSVVRSRIIAAVLVAVPLVMGAPLAAQGSAATPTTPKVVSAATLEVIASPGIPWRAEEAPDGSVDMVVGPGTGSVPIKAGTVAIAISSPAEIPGSGIQPTATPAAAAASWACTVSVDGPAISGSQIASYVGVSCTGPRPGSMRAEWWLDKRNYLVWSQYSSEHRYTSYTPAQALGTHIYNFCHQGAGSHPYRARATLNFQGVSASGGYSATSNTTTENCGDNE